MDSRGVVEPRVPRGSPRTIRLVILGQSILILLMSLFMVRELLENPYLDEYVSALIHGSFTPEMVFGLILLGVLGSGVFTLTVAWRYGQSVALGVSSASSLRAQRLASSRSTQVSSTTVSNVNAEPGKNGMEASAAPKLDEQQKG